MPTETPLNPMKARLDAGGVALGVLVSMPGVALVQALSRLDVDWLFIDMEHGPIDVESMHAMITATQGTRAAPLVRVPWNEHWLVKPALDAGAMGIIFPMIRSAEEAARAAQALRYPPTGVRGFGPIYASMRFDTTMGAHVDVADREIICQLLIEHRDAVDDIERIVEVPGVDVCQLAPFDLALSYGYRDGIDHAEVHDAIARVEEVVKASPVKLGGLAPSPEGARLMVEQGYDVILGGIDAALIQGAVQQVVDAVR